MIVVLLLFIGYQLYRISFDPTAGLIALTIFDAVIVLLTWREFRQQRRIRNDQARSAPSHADDAAAAAPADR
jgi:uncharacterized membrane protein